MIKKCSKCGLEKQLSEFYQRKKHRTGEHYEKCKECMKDRGRKYYHLNHERQLFLAKLRKIKYIKMAKELIEKLKKDKPCADCGKIFPPFVMDFDHRDGEVKITSVSNFASHRSSNLEKIKQEVSKYDLVCANCHRVRTYQRMHAAVAKVVTAGA